jgi:hypothetical protein
LGGIFGSGTSNSVLYLQVDLHTGCWFKPFSKNATCISSSFSNRKFEKIIGNISSAFSGRTYPNLEITGT